MAPQYFPAEWVIVPARVSRARGCHHLHTVLGTEHLLTCPRCCPGMIPEGPAVPSHRLRLAQPRLPPEATSEAK